MLRYHRKMQTFEPMYGRVARAVAELLGPEAQFSSEWCYHLEGRDELSEPEVSRLTYLLSETFDPEGFGSASWLPDSSSVLELGPRPNFETAASSTSLNVLRKIGIDGFTRAERSWRIGLTEAPEPQVLAELAEELHDRMTEMVYSDPPLSFQLNSSPEPTFTIPMMEYGLNALLRFNSQRELGFDSEDCDWLMWLFVEHMGRNPTNVELNMLAQAMSDHSRHTIWRASLVRGGEELPYTLWELIQHPLQRHRGNVLVGFADDSSAIVGYDVDVLMCESQTGPAQLYVARRSRAIICTGETHNHPSGVEPYQGAYTGGTGMLRDVFSMGQGSFIGTVGSGYAVGRLALPNLGWVHVPGPWIEQTKLLVEASNGLSAGMNCHGVPVTGGWVQSYSRTEPSGQHVGWECKPIVHAQGTGTIDMDMLHGEKPQSGQCMVLLGGPNYRIGMGGASASSVPSGQNTAQADFDSVQRGDAEMQQRVYRVVKALVEVGIRRGSSVIKLIHDLGAGGNCNAIPEAAEGAGARVWVDRFAIADPTLSDEEVFANESQEREVIVIDAEDWSLVQQIAARENCPAQNVGDITGDGKIQLVGRDGELAVDMVLDDFLGRKMQKRREFEPWSPQLQPLMLPKVEISDMLERVLQLPSIASKRYLTSKADRSVGGLVAQQQCVGPWQLTLADYSLEAHSFFGSTGTARAFGEAAIVGLVDPEEAARLSVCEAVMNLMGVRLSDVLEASLQVNWMWAARADMDRYQRAVKALSDYCCELELTTDVSHGLAPDGGKDSNSIQRTMADGSVVIAPGQAVTTAYAPVPNVAKKVTPDIKARQWSLTGSTMVWVRFSNWGPALGGSALAQAYDQLGDEAPKAAPPQELLNLKRVIDDWIDQDYILALHDVGQGGLVTAAAEMAFGGGCGVLLDFQLNGCSTEGLLFGESPGLLLEVPQSKLYTFLTSLREQGLLADAIGRTHPDWHTNKGLQIKWNGRVVLQQQLVRLLEHWERTSHVIDRVQSNPFTADHEYTNFSLGQLPRWRLTYQPRATSPGALISPAKPKLGVIREEGSNGDEELKAAWMLAGFEVHDITMTDLVEGRVTLLGLSGISLPGGFSYGDVLDAGKAWASVIRFNARVADEFAAYRERADNFIFGPCNACQLMALLGWLDPPGTPERDFTRFVHNRSARFESRFVTVHVPESEAVLLRGMAGSRLGVWLSSGEGQHRPGAGGTPALQYVNPYGDLLAEPGDYPHNPNGSADSVAGVCGRNGQDLAMMPHPERTPYRLEQFPWLPRELRDLPVSPWARLFQNGYDFVRNS